MHVVSSTINAVSILSVLQLMCVCVCVCVRRLAFARIATAIFSQLSTLLYLIFLLRFRAKTVSSNWTSVSVKQYYGYAEISFFKCDYYVTFHELQTRNDVRSTDLMVAHFFFFNIYLCTHSNPYACLYVHQHFIYSQIFLITITALSTSSPLWNTASIEQLQWWKTMSRSTNSL